MPNRYRNTNVLRNKNGRRYYINSVYPDIPVTESDTYVIATVGDRYDVLADAFYGDSSLWWIIAAANNSKKDSLIPTPGTQLRIPFDPSAIRDLYETLNANR
jgi:nucleoid-associated protein YgaU